MEYETVIQSEVCLAASVTRPSEDDGLPAIVVLPGTGKTDRDGNGGRFRTDFYRNLCLGFSDTGFVTVRYDKRGCHGSGGKALCGFDDLVSDALSVIRYTKNLPYVDSERIIVCGHSEGGMIATVLSETEKTAGMILLGSAGSNLEDALLYQNSLLIDEIKTMKD